MTQKTQTAKALTALIALALFVTGCTKKRDATLSEEASETIFSISEIESANSQYQIKTDDAMNTLSFGEASKATAEKGLVAISEAQVPERLKYMFKGLEMTAQSGRSYKIMLSVDKQFVTAYKIVTDLSELSLLEAQLAQVKEEVTLQKQLQKEKHNTKVKSLMTSLQKVRSEKKALFSQKDTQVLVPVFKFPIKGYGTLNRVKNELREETSNLRLKSTDWSEATHIQMSNNPSDRVLVGLDPASRGNLDRTFVMNKINNKVMTAGMLGDNFQIPVNLEKDTRVLTLLDVDALHVFELGQVGKTVLTDSQLQQLKSGSKKSNVRACTEDILKALPAEEQKDCVMVLRYDVPVTYVKAELPVVDYDGNQNATIQFKPVRAGDNVGLVQIAENVQAQKIEANNQMDPRTTLRVADIKDKEFFFKRTLEDAPETTIFVPGMAGALTIVKFDMEESRLVVRKADKLLNHKNGSNKMEYEELMSIPVKYFKYDKKDATGTEYSMARMAPATRVDAQFVEIDWTRNTLASDYSPYETLRNSCIRSIGDTQVSDVDMKLEQGVLNFSFQYSAGLSAYCISQYRTANSYNGNPDYSTTARMKERVSFKLNDGSTDKSFAPEVPFSAQNAMGYGVWTIGQINPDEKGLTGREGQERNMVVLHDFNGGKVLLYTVTGLEPSANIPADIRELYKETTRDIVNAWDFAYKQAFKGTKFERSGRYVEVQFAGENGITATVGDLDKNIVHFENKYNDNHGILGVSQVGFNPRSGIVVADSLIVYAGNLQEFVAGYQRNLKIANDWNDMKEKFRQEALTNLAAQQQKEEEAAKAQGAAAAPNATAETKIQNASQFTKHLVDVVLAHKKEVGGHLKGKDLSSASSKVKSITDLKKSLGSSGAFKYASPNMEEAWLDRALRKLKENPSMDRTELEGIIANEMLTSKGAKLSAVDKQSLTDAVHRGDIRTKLNAQFKHTPGCLMTAAGTMSRQFAASSFKDALRNMLYFDLGHEMGHSQGLTHNFKGSFDQANFKNMDGSESKRNYSSIMDYFTPGTFNWDGIGTYDIHALRASHTGLIEGKDGKLLDIENIKNFAGGKWVDVTDYAVKQAPIKQYAYCTDIHVQLEPTCQRFDSGSSATEIVTNLIENYDNNYITNYHSWDRNDFYLGNAGSALGRSMHTMFTMRQFMDELFYMLYLGQGTQEERQDYFQASLKVYIFLNQVIRTPDANSLFISGDRFMAVPYQYREVDANGQETGKALTDVQIVEKRALQNVAVSDYRLDTIGIENDKIMALNFLTMQGFPMYKYYSSSLVFSFLDFEQTLLGMGAQESIYVNTVTGMLLNELQPSFTNDKVTLGSVQGAQARVTAAMRAYASIYSILNLEATTLRDQDNFANLFKVGTSVGAAPSDRTALSQLGVDANSKTRVSYWAVDNAMAANAIISEAATKNEYLKASPALTPLLEKLALMNIQDMLSGGKAADAVTAARTELIAKINELNANGALISPELVKANPQLSVEGQIEMMEAMNKQVTQIAIAVLQNQKVPNEVITQLKAQATNLEKNLPLFSLSIKALKSALDKVGQSLAKNPQYAALANLSSVAGNVVNGSELEVSYGIIMKNLDFLNKLSLMTNPELNRQ